MISIKGHLVMSVDNPQVVLAAIATARLKSINGKELLVVPHCSDEVRVLRNLGLQVPPIALDFKYTGRHQPFAHQRSTVDFLVLNRKAFNLSDMGSGKTKAALWAAEYLRLKGKIGRVLVICPLSVISVWEEECFNTVPHRSFCRLLGTKERRLDLLSKGSDICVINHDGVGTILEPLKKAGFDLIIGDEASAWRNAQTRRYKQFRELAKQTAWVWLMTGTPAPKAPTDAYALSKLVSNSFPGGFTLWKEITMQRVSAFKWVARADSKEFVYKHLQPAIRFKKEDCIDLPPLVYVNRSCELTEQQNKAFKLMKQKFIMEKDSGEKITAANSAVRLLKLLQICCGVIKDNEGEYHKLDCSNRLETVQEFVEEAGGKVIISVPFIGVMEMVTKYLREQGWSVGLVNGSVGERERTKIFDEFQRGDLDNVVVHPKTAAHGLNLTASASILHYAPIFSVEQYLQINNRISRPGQKRNMTIGHIISTPLEAALYRALWGGIQMQQAILEQYQEILR